MHHLKRLRTLYHISLSILIAILLLPSTPLHARRQKGKKARTQSKASPKASKQEGASTHLAQELDKASTQAHPQRRRLIELGETLLGKPYRSRGIASWPLDCSGYVSYLYSKIGLSIPRSSSALSQSVIRTTEPQKGDLVFFKGRNSGSSRVGHVAIVVENLGDDLIIMHSTNSRGIIQHRLSQNEYFRKRFLFSGRIPALAGHTIAEEPLELSPNPETALPDYLLRPSASELLNRSESQSAIQGDTGKPKTSLQL